MPKRVIVYATIDGMEIRVFKGALARWIAYLGLAKAKIGGRSDIW